ncbi:hypothetical protein [Uliginosibacterium sp. 31-12]|uniref:hypothetical protein n=1 Tax=Uliginosibacterium sp. 31-12 TaxID=3062781 RepID=UPI0026E2A026|nr:hypothetical protein [Uliginosibacterium sp. 31-12]MDO6386274.1 hypothetical protein [Uliginosibacterium sp. 31-12]
MARKQALSATDRNSMKLAARDARCATQRNCSTKDVGWHAVDNKNAKSIHQQVIHVFH